MAFNNRDFSRQCTATIFRNVDRPGGVPRYRSGLLGDIPVVTTLIVHNFLGIQGADEQENQIFHFLKNMLILAAAVVFLSVALGSAEWSYGAGVSFFS